MEPELNPNPKPTTLYSVLTIETLAKCDELLEFAYQLKKDTQYKLTKKLRQFTVTTTKYEHVPEKLAKAQQDLQEVTNRLDQCKDPIAREGYLDMQKVLLREVKTLNMATEKYGLIPQIFLNKDVNDLERCLENAKKFVSDLEGRRTELIQDSIQTQDLRFNI